MKKSDRGDEVFGDEVGIKSAELVGLTETFVHQGAVGKGGHVKLVDAFRADVVFGPPSSQVEGFFELFARTDLVSGHEQL